MTANPGVTVDHVVVAGLDSVVSSTQAPFSLSFEVPLEALGTYQIAAFGKDSNTETYYQSLPVALIAQTTATLQTLAIDPAEPVLFGPRDTLQLSLVGQFDDAVARIIPVGDATWSVDDPTVATVDTSGLLTAMSLGSTTVHGSADSLEVTATVNVTSKVPLVFNDGFESGDATEWSSTTGGP